MQYGLSGGQVAKMLMYFMPATQTWSLPIAALFATTVVLWPLAADNELTACRAHGISYLTMALPAFGWGLILACVSFACLSFIVPRFTLRAEKVAFQSLADVVQKNIQRSHQLKLEGFVVYWPKTLRFCAAGKFGRGTRWFVSPAPCSARIETRVDREERSRLSVPDEFYTARFATVVIHQAEDHVEFYSVSGRWDDVSAQNSRARRTENLAGWAPGNSARCSFTRRIKGNTSSWICGSCAASIRAPRNPRKSASSTSPLLSRNRRPLSSTPSPAPSRAASFVSFLIRRAAWVCAGTGARRAPAARQKSKLSFTSGETPGTRYVRLIRHQKNDEQLPPTRPAISPSTFTPIWKPSACRSKFQLGDVAITGDEGRPANLLRASAALSANDIRLLAIESRGPEFYTHRGAAHGDENRTKLVRKLTGLRNGIESRFTAALLSRSAA